MNKKIMLSSGKEFEIQPEKYADYMAYLEEIFTASDEIKNEQDSDKAKVKLQALQINMFTLEKRYQKQKLEKCVVSGDFESISVGESKELLDAIDELSKPAIEEKN